MSEYTNPFDFSEDPTFFVQNVTKGHHVVNDIKMPFMPYEVKDLSNEATEVLKESRDIRKSIMNGQLVRISEAEANEALAIEIELLRQEEMQEMEEREMRQYQVGDKLIEAEAVDTHSARAGHRNSAVSTVGLHNDHNSYAQAFQSMRQSWANQGRVLTARQFGQMVEDDPSIVRTTLRNGAGAWSGDPGRGRATYATAPDREGRGTSVRQSNMTNWNRDGRMAGASSHNIKATSNNMDMMETIDLEADDEYGYGYDGEADGSGIRRVS